MKFSIERDQLLEALQKVQSVVEKKNTVPILANILCIAEKDQLSLCATDLEVGIKNISSCNYTRSRKGHPLCKAFSRHCKGTSQQRTPA